MGFFRFKRGAGEKVHPTPFALSWSKGFDKLSLNGGCVCSNSQALLNHLAPKKNGKREVRSNEISTVSSAGKWAAGGQADAGPLRRVSGLLALEVHHLHADR